MAEDIKNQVSDDSEVQEQTNTGEEPENQAEASSEQDEQDESANQDNTSDDVGDDDLDDDTDESDDQSQPDDEPKKPSRRENKRIQQLIKNMQANQQIDDPQGGQNVGQGSPAKIIDEGDYDLDEINQIANDYANKRYQEGLNQSNQASNNTLFETRMEVDAPQVMSEFDELNPDSENFQEPVASVANQLYLLASGYSKPNPNLRYKEFVEGLMGVVDDLAEARASNTSKNIAKQSASAGVRPSGAAKKPYSGTDPAKMSDEQLDAILKQQYGY